MATNSNEVAQVTWDTDKIIGAADYIDKLIKDMEEIKASYESAKSNLMEGWTGEASVAHYSDMDKEITQLGDFIAKLKSFENGVRDAADCLNTAANTIAGAIEEADSQISKEPVETFEPVQLAE